MSPKNKPATYNYDAAVERLHEMNASEGALEFLAYAYEQAMEDDSSATPTWTDADLEAFVRTAADA